MRWIVFFLFHWVSFVPRFVSGCVGLPASIVRFSGDGDSVRAPNNCTCAQTLLLSHLGNKIHTCGPVESQLKGSPTHPDVNPLFGVEVQRSLCFRPPWPAHHGTKCNGWGRFVRLWICGQGSQSFGAQRAVMLDTRPYSDERTQVREKKQDCTPCFS